MNTRSLSRIICMLIISLSFSIAPVVLAQNPPLNTTTQTPTTVGQKNTSYTPLVPLDSIGQTTGKNFNQFTDVKAQFPRYLNGMFQILISLASVIAVVMIVYGGVKYMSTDAYTNKTEGKEIISRTLWGIFLVIASWLILFSINSNIADLSSIGKSTQTVIDKQPAGTSPSGGGGISRNQGSFQPPKFTPPQGRSGGESQYGDKVNPSSGGYDDYDPTNPPAPTPGTNPGPGTGPNPGPNPTPGGNNPGGNNPGGNTPIDPNAGGGTIGAIPGDVQTARPGDSLGNKINGLSSGQTLVLEDGTYTGGFSVRPNNVTIRARNLGKVTITPGDNKVMAVEGTGVKISGIIFTGGGTSCSVDSETAASRIEGSGAIIEDSTFEKSKGVGIKVDGENVTLRRVVIKDNGSRGIGGKGDKMLIAYSKILNNNNSCKKGDGGGTKFTRTNGLVIDHVEAAYNTGPGLWFDIKNVNTTVQNSYSHDNKTDGSPIGKGIFFELNGKEDYNGPIIGMSKIHNNIIASNGKGGSESQRGILISASANVTITNNTIIDDIISIFDCGKCHNNGTVEVKNITIKDNKLLDGSKIVYNGVSKSCCDEGSNSGPGASGVIGPGGSPGSPAPGGATGPNAFIIPDIRKIIALATNLFE